MGKQESSMNIAKMKGMKKKKRRRRNRLMVRSKLEIDEPGCLQVAEEKDR
jgi:hypothetical protein